MIHCEQNKLFVSARLRARMRHVYIDAHGVQRALNPLEPELQVVVNCLV